MRFNVHIYREMRLFFPDIEADTPETAAAICEELPTSDAAYTEDCDGASLAALVDVVGDDSHSMSEIIDFEYQKQFDMAPRLLATLRNLLACDLHANLAGGFQAQIDEAEEVLAEAEKIRGLQNISVIEYGSTSDGE